MKSNKISKNKRVVVAMSGGVDSSVAAYLLKKEGYDVVGIFLKLWSPPCFDSCATKKQNLCCDDKAMAIARQIADKLEIPFYVVKVDKLFKKEIVDNFVSEYELGRTPNPCVRCNKYIKFGYLWEKARQLNADYLATGHYIRIAEIPNNKLQITNKSQIPNTKNFENCNLGFVCDLELGACNYIFSRSKDVIKDQTYFLSSIDPAIISHLLFPLGSITKKEVRSIAKKAKLPVYNKKDSMGVCFIPDGDTGSFLKSFSSKLQKPGEVVDKAGNILGKHSGLLGYTIGQKVGDDQIAAGYMKKMSKSKLQMSNQTQNLNDKKLGVEAPDVNFKFDIGNLTFKPDVPRLYITAIDSKKNRLVVGENEDCFSDTVDVKDFNVINNRFWNLTAENKTLYAQIRGGHRAEQCRIISVGATGSVAQKSGRTSGSPLQKIIIKFTKKVRAITPGQTIALYDKDVLLGGGIIA